MKPIAASGRRRFLHLRLRVAGEKQESLLSFLREAVPFYEEPGGIHVRLLRSLEDPARFIEEVEYRDAETYDRDQVRVESDARMRSLLDRWRVLLEGPAEVERYEDVTGLLWAENGGEP